MIKAADVKKLREITGAGMMDCKKALTETNGDFDAAIDFLRKKGQKIAAKRADREATEGVIISSTNADSTKGIIIHLTAETDFVSRNADFVSFAQSISDLAIKEGPATREELLDMQIGGSKVSELILEKTGTIGEKIELASFEVLEGDTVVPYNHAGNSIGVLVALNSAKNDDVVAVAKDVAMQIAAMKPIAVDEGQVTQDVIDKELEIGRELARQEGKPEAMIEKIAQGKLKRFYKDFTLLNQQFVKDSKQTVKSALAAVEPSLTVTSFKRVDLGK